MTGVQTCALPICFPVTIVGVAADDAKLYDIEDITNEAHQDWYFGHIAYTYKSFVEKQLENSLPVFNAFPPTLFFRPTSVIYIERISQVLIIESDQDPILIYNQIMSAQSMVEPIQETLDFETSESQVDYITKIKRIQEHIRMGDCYELKYRDWETDRKSTRLNSSHRL